ncbi:MAG TPA: Rieske 2Fe-2S domain-containing protein [Acidimicrobiales bacterium]|nr:Rieske 2Fe-2S domain-containing protein [Acidimicrobiales bacterium]
MDDGVRAGSVEELERDGRLLTKVAALPVVVLWHEGRPWAIEDRCPHMGFPLHQGTVEAGLLTCHWHHARFDLASGCTLDPWADDATAFDVTVHAGDVWVRRRAVADPEGRLRHRLAEGLEHGITLVTAKATLGLLDIDPSGSSVVATALEHGTTYRAEGWGSGLTVLSAMANVLPHLDPDDRALALVHALTFVSRDTCGHAPRFAETALATQRLTAERLAIWYRRFVDTRSADAAERTLATAIASVAPSDVEAMMFAAVTDHVFIDEGHTLDFTNKAFEALAMVDGASAAGVLGSLVAETCAADRSEETSEWRHPHDLAGLLTVAQGRLDAAVEKGWARAGSFTDVAGLAWNLLDDDPDAVIGAVLDAIALGATPEQVGRAVAYAAALRIARFHTQNDFGDWNSVHHAFTAANALHQALVRCPTPELLRGALHGALRIYLDRFLNVPAARLPSATTGALADLAACWDIQGGVDQAGAIAYGYLRDGGSRAELIATLGHALLAEDAGFHWYQVFEAGVRQAQAWPEGSEESALVLTAIARFLAAHTPTRRELPTVVRIASRLRRGESLYEES